MLNKRKHGRDARKKLDKDVHKLYSQKICRKIQEIITDKNIIMLYNPIDGEVDVSELKKLRQKKFLFPRVEENDLVAVKSEKFVIGSYGISEPIGNPFSGEIDAVIVPMCAYDEFCNRIGFGKGYYDRFLKNKSCLKIGVAFSCQQTDGILVKDSDIKMDIIITENGVVAL